jgi:hypothetical protein
LRNADALKGDVELVGGDLRHRPRAAVRDATLSIFRSATIERRLLSCPVRPGESVFAGPRETD